MYTLKQIPEDFIVTEVSNLELKEASRFAYLLLKKTNRNTLDCIKEIAKQLKLKEKDLGFAGSKDRNAITSQLISVKGVSKEKINKINLDNCKIKILGYGNKPISLGDLSGNKFEITIRNLDEVNIQETNFVANYFDEQRFSISNADIGRHLVKKEFKEAVILVNNFKANEHLKKSENDFIGALKKLPKRLLMMYVHAYQSYLWNETLRIYLERNSKVTKKVKYSLGKFIFVNEKSDLTIPLIGFDDSLVTKETEKIIAEIMKAEDLDFSDFVIKQVPELSLEGDLRDAFVEIKDLKVGKTGKDDLNYGKKKVKVSFELGKGSYATMVIRKIIN